jgi:hypothetical protein
VSAWLRVERGPDGGFVAPAGVGPDAACFVEGTAESVSWGRCYPVHDADLAAAREWAVTAQAVAAAVPCEVAAIVGEGALAALVRLALPPNSIDPNTPPGVVVETTGTATGITAALRLVRPGGSIVLAVRPLSTTTPLRTYHDVHRPGVRLVPVPWASDGARSAPGNLLAWALAHLTSVEPGQPAPPGPWYRLAIGAHARNLVENAESRARRDGQ